MGGGFSTVDIADLSESLLGIFAHKHKVFQLIGDTDEALSFTRQLVYGSTDVSDVFQVCGPHAPVVHLIPRRVAVLAVSGLSRDVFADAVESLRSHCVVVLVGQDNPCPGARLVWVADEAAKHEVSGADLLVTRARNLGHVMARTAFYRGYVVIATI